MKNQPFKKGDHVGAWVLGKHIGEGGQGVVWKARRPPGHHSPPVAVKICTHESEKARKRFEREIDLLKQCHHPGVIRVCDRGVHDGMPFFAMELASMSFQEAILDEKGTSSRLVRESGVLLLDFLRQACVALAELHRKGVVHRDIKPSNI